MPAPKPVGEGDGFTVSWTDILADWDTIVADLYAVYGTAVDTVWGWLDLRRMILGLMSRKESVFAVGKATERQKLLDAQKKKDAPSRR